MDTPVATFNIKILERKFTTRIYPISHPLPEDAGMLGDFFALWQSRILGEKLPSRKDITFETLTGWHSGIRLVDMGENIEDSKSNLILGEIYRSYWGSSTMEKQIISMGAEGKKVMNNYRRILNYLYTKHYNVNIGVGPNFDGSLRQIVWVDLPLADDGENMSHLLSALVPLPE